jgi:hypothetical protein
MIENMRLIRDWIKVEVKIQNLSISVTLRAIEFLQYVKRLGPP